MFRVVQGMHQEINKQKNKISQLEKIIFKFNNMCTESLENDLARLEKRKVDLINELSRTDDEILEVQERLTMVKSEVEKMINPLSLSSDKIMNGTNDKKNTNKKITSATDSKNTKTTVSTSAAHNHISQLDEEYLEETELVETIKQANFSTIASSKDHSSILFIIHLSSTADIYVYKRHMNQQTAVPQEDSADALVSVVKLPNRNDLSRFINLPIYEKLMVRGLFN